jgi:hypothetical protein
MNWSQGGDFTKNLLSLQLQLKTLLEGVGGEDTAALLDAIAGLNKSERAVAIPLLARVIQRVASGENRLSSQEDKELKDFEDSLFNSIVEAFGNTASANDLDLAKEKEAKLAILPGGKTPSERVAIKKPIRIPALIDLAKERETRRGRNAQGPRDSA